MIHSVLGILLVFAAPIFTVDKLDPVAQTISFSYSGADVGMIEKAMHDGLQIEVLYNFKLCKHRRFWLDRCSTEGIERKVAKLDPISQSYKVSIDRIGDGHPALNKTYESLDDALIELTRVEEFSLALLASDRELKRYFTNQRSYFALRQEVSLPGTRGVLHWVPYVLTLGLVDSTERSSDWAEFYIGDIKR